MAKLSHILFLSLLLIGFSVESSASFKKKKPKWVTNKPIDNDYYIGVGKSEKKQTDFIQIAKNNAFADLISEISVNISSNSILQQLEDNFGYKEKYAALIQTTAKEEIKNYELVDSWSNKDEYWVYYRLSKEEYQRLKREKLDRAKQMAKDYYEKAKEYEKQYDINNALLHYIKSFDAIKTHLGEDLSVFTFDGRIFLDNAIYQSVQDILSRIQFVPEKEKFEIKALSSKNEPILVRLKLKTDLETQNIESVPLVFSINEQSLKKKQTIVSSEKGYAECTLASYLSKGDNQQIKVEIDLDYYFGDDNEENILKTVFLERGTKPYSYLNIEVKELFAYLESEEIIFESETNTNQISQIYKRELSESFFSFTKDLEKADVVIKINSTIRKGTKLDNHNLHTVFLNSNITIKDLKTDLIIFTEGFENLKGMKSGSFDEAAQDVILKAQKKINNIVIPNIRKINI